MNKYALIIVTENITVKYFEYKDDFDTARQAVLTQDKHCIPLKWHNSIKKWVQPEVLF